MKSKAIVCAIALASLGFGSLSFAQGFDRRGPGGEAPRFEQRGHGQRDARDAYPRGLERRELRHDRHPGARASQFYRGERIPTEYRQRHRAVNNWQARRLHAPAHGQQWVQVGTDYALIAIATGLIAQLVLNR